MYVLCNVLYWIAMASAIYYILFRYQPHPCSECGGTKYRDDGTECFECLEQERSR